MPINALRGVFRTNLGVKSTERVLVFTDRPTKRERMGPEEEARRARLRDIANLAADIGRGVARKVVFDEYPAGGAHGKEPPRKIWEAAFGARAVRALEEERLLAPILRKRASAEKVERAARVVRKYRRSTVDAVVALSNYSTSHTTFRTLLCGACGTRYASMPLFEFPMLLGPLNVDWKALARRTRAVARELRRAVQVGVETPNGTGISFSMKGRRVEADTGLLAKPGSFGNLPAGEAFLAPLEGTASGTMVLEWAPTRKLLSPVTLTVREGLVADISGDEPFADGLREKLAERPENANIAELGVGTNEHATRPENILESEKILGTVHMALGDNASFGGTVKTPFHQDFVFFRPTVQLTDRDGRCWPLLEDGRLLVPGA